MTVAPIVPEARRVEVELFRWAKAGLMVAGRTRTHCVELARRSCQEHAGREIDLDAFEIAMSYRKIEPNYSDDWWSLDFRPVAKYNPRQAGRRRVGVETMETDHRSRRNTRRVGDMIVDEDERLAAVAKAPR